MPKYSGVTKMRMDGEEGGRIRRCRESIRERNKTSSVKGPAM